MIDAGRVLVNGSVAQKAARQVNTSEAVHVASPPARFVSRGGLKLDRALHVFGIDPTDRTAVDAGSATGGFTDCLSKPARSLSSPWMLGTVNSTSDSESISESFPSSAPTSAMSIESGQPVCLLHVQPRRWW